MLYRFGRHTLPYPNIIHQVKWLLFLLQELYSGGSDCNILVWAPPPPRLPEVSQAVASSVRKIYSIVKMISHDVRLPVLIIPISQDLPGRSRGRRTRAAGVYQDSWSSDEEDWIPATMLRHIINTITLIFVIYESFVQQEDIIFFNKRQRNIKFT